MLQRTVPSELLGRVSATIRLVEWAPGILGALVGGLLGDLLGLREALVVLGTGCLLGVPWVATAAVRGQLNPNP